MSFDLLKKTILTTWVTDKAADWLIEGWLDREKEGGSN